jgi:hypothetical protein
MRNKKIKKCAEWLAYCLEIGGSKSDLDGLQELWMANHDDNGNYKAQLQQHSVMQVPQFEELLQVRLDELPYTKHLDDGQYNDGQVAGFEYGARWLYEKLSSGTAVGRSGGDNPVRDGF